ncbi:PqqD family protein [Alkaliphilus hydrothermalis]|uniref:Coenzyme PQQ synthesis protein D (PqqD) n=1 Tax=Alkaliphilus hydrothermalis TaxID=1482730 RepID=A0ABS2NRB9_9FIRM|nr:PqqD family peptide modification chaperone [Alkaliphilus hydrothermalis]MBM7615503.1 hypothetical protein [Alkaliphilus hydrothermalis]
MKKIVILNITIFFYLYAFSIFMVSENQILHKTTYIWKEEEACAVIITNEGKKIILNPSSTMIWKLIDDDSTVDMIINTSVKENGLKEDQCMDIIKDLINVGIVTNEDYIWGDSLL